MELEAESSATRWEQHELGDVLIVAGAGMGGLRPGVDPVGLNSKRCL